MDYKNFFDEFNKFKETQNEQKKSGLNDFNLLMTVLNYDDEVRLHSRMIGKLLDPSGKHYQDILFLEKFIETIKLDRWGLDLPNVKVNIEYRDIDLYITDGRKHIIIENKIWAKDQPCQIIKYINIIVEENIEKFDLGNEEHECTVISKEVLQVIYLTAREKKEPNEHKIDNNGYISFDGEDYTLEECSQKVNTKSLVPDGLKRYKARFKKIDYKNDILTWLNNCQKEVTDLIDLNESIKQYIDVVKKVSGTYEGKVMSLKQFMSNNDELYEHMSEIVREIPDLKEQIEKDFWNELKVALSNINNGSIIMKEYEGKKPFAGLILTFPKKFDLHILREHNLYYSVEQINEDKKDAIIRLAGNVHSGEKVTWKYICESKDSKEMINMEKGNAAFWKLGRKKIRENIILEIVKITKDLSEI